MTAPPKKPALSLTALKRDFGFTTHWPARTEAMICPHCGESFECLYSNGDHPEPRCLVGFEIELGLMEREP